MFRHILPNLVAAVVVQSTIDLAYAILDIAALSFLGLGQQPPDPDWGSMLADGRSYLLQNPIRPASARARDHARGHLLQPRRRRAALPARPEGARPMSAERDGRRDAVAGAGPSAPPLLEVRDLDGRLPHDRRAGPRGERRRPRRSRAGEIVGLVGRVRIGQERHAAGRSWASSRRGRAASGAASGSTGEELVGMPESRYRRVRGERDRRWSSRTRSPRSTRSIGPGSRSPRRSGSTSGSAGRRARARVVELFETVGLPAPGGRRRSDTPTSSRAACASA